MLTIFDPRPSHDCQGFRRREFLRVGSLGLFGLSLPRLLEASASAAPAVKDYATGRAVVLLFLGGGPSHVELFDPKMTAPSEIHSVTGEVKTVLPGITFGGTFPQLAALADKFSIVRSYGSKNAGHEYHPVTTAGNPLKAAFGALYTRIAGTMNPHTGAPLHTVVLPEAVAPPKYPIGQDFETAQLPGLTQPGALGPNYEAFNPGGGGQLRKDMELSIPAARFNDRKFLLSSLNGFRRQAEIGGQLDSLDQLQQQAFDVISAAPRPLSICRRKTRAPWLATTRATASSPRKCRPGATCGGRRICSGGKCCWPGGWSRRAAASSASPIAAGTCTATAIAPRIWPA